MLKFSLLTLGAIAAGLGCYGAYEYTLRLEGTMSYLVLAAPVVAGAAALIPYYAERLWQAKHRIKALLWMLILIPTAATVFYSATERVHYAKAGAEASRSAAHTNVTRAEAAVADAKAKVVKAEADAKAARKLPRKQCDDRCLARWDDEAKASRLRLADAMSLANAIEAQAVKESPLTAPVWLLPLALDLIAFTAIWSGLGMVSKKPSSKIRRKVARRRKPKPTPSPLRLVA
jgi:hypothetical protein